MDARYEIVDHTADICVETRGRDLAELFENAGWAFTDVLCGAGSVRQQVRETVSVSADDLELTFNAWLGALLSRFSEDGMLFSGFKTVSALDSSYSCEVMGELYSPERHSIAAEIKAVTFHQLSVRKATDGWKARVVFDV